MKVKPWQKMLGWHRYDMILGELSKRIKVRYYGCIMGDVKI
jgi:hypothetical protein